MSRITQQEPREDLLEWQRFLAEVVGTFALTFVAAGAEVIDALTGQIPAPARVAAPGLMVVGLVYAIGNVSGAHVNPAVTFAFALRGAFEWSRVPLYWLAQIIGAVAAAGVLRALFGAPRHLGSTVLRVTTGRGLAIEVVLTFLLASIVLGTAAKHSLIGPQAALPVGATIILAGFLGGSLTGASMNPARSIGPALVSATWDRQWVYVAGPMLGAACAVAAGRAMLGPHREEESEAARGER